MRPDAIRAVMSAGVVFVCAHCESFWWGAVRGLDSCKAVHDKIECGGPMGGMDYPEYSGPLKGHLERFCFLCGQTADAAVEINKSNGVSRVGMVGVCKDHVDSLSEFSAPGKKPPFVTRKSLPIIG